MQDERKPTILVFPAGKYVEFYIRQDGEHINFRLDRETYQLLKAAQEKYDESQTQEHDPVSLRVVGSE